MSAPYILSKIISELKDIKRVLPYDGKSSKTTLVQSRRWSNGYLNMLAGSGALASRSLYELSAVFDEMEMQVAYEIKGNLAFIKQ